GARGLLDISQAGGETLVQDELTSVIYGMPKAAAALGGAKRQLPIGDIAPALISLSGAVAARSTPGPGDPKKSG
ncbi:MAG TPA: chemotaxis protein CheB, partial [Myxococcaceae bacterium]|nr:chemotaxis protein CheB [Myxococcaceae bacterium]